jgi:hypothetical protein
MEGLGSVLGVMSWLVEAVGGGFTAGDRWEQMAVSSICAIVDLRSLRSSSSVSLPIETSPERELEDVS